MRESLFGTDGLRGVYGRTLTEDIAYDFGRALTKLRARPRVLLCRDTRESGVSLSDALADGVLSGGGTAVKLGILPTPAIVRFLFYEHADFGVVISASHNPKEYNGIKVFDDMGRKLSLEQERALESYLRPSSDFYEQFLMNCAPSLSGLKVVLDCANGATSGIAGRVFRGLGAWVLERNTCGVINENCGALYPENSVIEVLKAGADCGFCYDGDGDRLIAVDEKGSVVNGDQILYILSEGYDKVVGTVHTNLAVKEALERRGATFYAADIGDRFVGELMRKTGARIGGEQSGHTILADYSTTGDGILTSLKLAERILRRPLSALADLPLYAQCNLNLPVQDRFLLMQNEGLLQRIAEINDRLAGHGRLVVRASGTEEKIRIFAECDEKEAAECAAREILVYAEGLCAES